MKGKLTVLLGMVGVVMTLSSSKVKAHNSIPSSEDECENTMARASVTQLDLSVLETPPTSYLERYYDGNKKIPALKNANRNVKVYITRTPYKRTSYNNAKKVSAGSKVYTVANAIRAGFSVPWAKKMLASAGIKYIEDKISKAVYPPKAQYYTFNWGIEGYIYDSTAKKADVEVTENWYNCKAVLGFNDSGKLNYILQSYPDNYPIPHSTSALSSLASSKAKTVASVYNSNIVRYGRWIHGIGNGIGY